MKLDQTRPVMFHSLKEHSDLVLVRPLGTQWRLPAALSTQASPVETCRLPERESIKRVMNCFKEVIWEKSVVICRHILPAVCGRGGTVGPHRRHLLCRVYAGNPLQCERYNRYNSYLILYKPVRRGSANEGMRAGVSRAPAMCVARLAADDSARPR
ncbi:hypothetical protein Bbelb_177080 [Branchiostoma belcheri]|nr:hypothetical protein Bbelb_177080 [Branchiostoma belcheri]